MDIDKKFTFRTASFILAILSVAMVPVLLWAAWDGEFRAFRGILLSWILVAACAFLGIRFTKRHKGHVTNGESYFVVLIAWLTLIGGGTLPYILSGEGFSPVDSIFESAAAYCTCGAWVIPLDHLPRALVLWRAISCWIGGLGITMIAVIAISAFGSNGKKLMNAELTGPDIDESRGKAKDTARLIALVYTAFTILEFLLLRLGGLPGFEAIINTMTSISTAGALDYQGAISHYFTPYIKVVLMAFSVLASFNFLFFVDRIKKRKNNPLIVNEIRVFLLLIALSALAVAVFLRISGVGENLFRNLIDAFGASISFASTSGYPIERISAWPPIARTVTILLMAVGGCAHSTSGGLKVIRFIVFFKLIERGMYKRIHQNAVKPVMIKKKVLSSQAVTSISTFILLYVSLYLVFLLLLSLENMDMETTLTAPLALLSNCGVGLGSIENACYSGFSVFGKLVSILALLTGRLEMFPILVLCSPHFWRKEKKF